MWSRGDTPAVGYYGDKTLLSLHLSSVSWNTENQSIPPHVAALVVSSQDRPSFGFTVGGHVRMLTCVCVCVCVCVYVITFLCCVLCV
jgi:hypothetical protein